MIQSSADGIDALCDKLAALGVDGLSIEDRFFELYKAQKGDEE